MAIRNMAHAIKSGEVTLGLAVGAESMSNEYALCSFISLRISPVPFSLSVPGRTLKSQK